MKKTITFTLFIFTSVMILTSCENSSTKQSTVNDSTSIEKNVTSNENIFDNTKKLTTALSQNGIGELEEWSNPMEMGWGSLSHYYQFGNKKDGIGMQNNIAYYLEGNETSAKILTINLNINNPAEKSQALEFLNEVTIKTFSSLDLEMPKDLTKAILSSKPLKSDIENFIISFELDKSKIETWKVNITRK